MAVSGDLVNNTWMSASAQQSQPANESPSFRRQSDQNDPMEAMRDLSLQETLRVMDVAREMRDSRVRAEEMFRQEDLRANLRDKLLRTAEMSGEDVTAAEIEAAIEQYFDRLHVYQDPPSGMNSFMAHLWVWRMRIAAATVTLGAAAGAFWYFF
ncbi:MAG: DUF6384 family protein [Planctomycetota bacterium]